MLHVYIPRCQECKHLGTVGGCRKKIVPLLWAMFFPYQSTFTHGQNDGLSNPTKLAEVSEEHKYISSDMIGRCCWLERKQCQHVTAHKFFICISLSTTSRVPSLPLYLADVSKTLQLSPLQSRWLDSTNDTSVVGCTESGPKCMTQTTGLTKNKKSLMFKVQGGGVVRSPGIQNEAREVASDVASATG